MSDSLQPHGLHSLWNTPGQNTEVGSLSILQGIFPTQGLNPGLLHCRQILYQLTYKGSPRILEWVPYPFCSGSSRPRNWTRFFCIAGRSFTNGAMREEGCRAQSNLSDNTRKSTETQKRWKLCLHFSQVSNAGLSFTCSILFFGSCKWCSTSEMRSLINWLCWTSSFWESAWLHRPTSSSVFRFCHSFSSSLFRISLRSWQSHRQPLLQSYILWTGTQVP